MSIYIYIYTYHIMSYDGIWNNLVDPISQPRKLWFSMCKPARISKKEMVCRCLPVVMHFL